MVRTHSLRADGFGVAFGDKVVLAELDFTVPTQSVTALLGPSGSGKSTFLRSVAGLNDAHPRYASWGQIDYLGAPLAADHRPRLVQQNARLMMASTADALLENVRSRLALSSAGLREWCADHVRAMGFPELATALDLPTVKLSTVQQRAVAIMREALGEPGLLMVDEPTAELPDYEAFLLLDLLRTVAAKCAVLVVLHNQKQAAFVAGHVVLLAGGRVQEAGSMEGFLAAPRSEAGQQFVRTGSCAVAAPDADPASLAEGVPPPVPLPLAAQQVLQQVGAARPAAAPASSGPRGFAWLVPGKLAGTPMPGVVADLDHDLAALRQVGVTRLITLTERDLPQAPLRQRGLANLHLPIYDREPPTVAQIQMLLMRMEGLLNKGEVLAVHCLAGLGRTGTVLAAWLIREGLTAVEALRRVRLIEPQYVQSVEQEAFLQHYEDTILRKLI